LTLNRCTVTGNTVNPNFVDSGGGGIFSVGTLTLNQCTVSGNEVNPQVGGPGGGGIYVYAGTATLNECTLSENLDFVGNNSSAILNSGTLRLNQCTISGNLEDSGIHNFFNAGAGASILVTNCIIAGNGEDIRVDSGTTVTFRGSNIVQSLNNQGTVVGTPINAAPNLAPLGNYGGPTQTMPPLPGSPAIDTGSDSATNTFAFDQRGLARLQGLHVDIGAVEGGYNTGGPGKLKNFLWIGNGSSRFGFTNFTGMSFTVLASTNPALPLNSWSVLGPAVESPAGSGQYQFTDPAATNHPSRFYSVRSP